jgi:hypothetical protein
MAELLQANARLVAAAAAMYAYVAMRAYLGDWEAREILRSMDATTAARHT